MGMHRHEPEKYGRCTLPCQYYAEGDYNCPLFYGHRIPRNNIMSDNQWGWCNPDPDFLNCMPDDISDMHAKYPLMLMQKLKKYILQRSFCHLHRQPGCLLCRCFIFTRAGGCEDVWVRSNKIMLQLPGQFCVPRFLFHLTFSSSGQDHQPLQQISSSKFCPLQRHGHWFLQLVSPPQLSLPFLRSSPRPASPRYFPPSSPRWRALQPSPLRSSRRFRW